MVMTKAIDETISQINDLVKFTEKTLKSNNRYIAQVPLSRFLFK